MFKYTAHCDICDKKLQIVKKQTPFGEVEVVKTARTKVLDTKMILPHLCEECALKIDNEILMQKLILLKKE